jgi:hypothetical protein
MHSGKKMTPSIANELISLLEGRFIQNRKRHAVLDWATVSAKLTPEILLSLYEMEQSGGEPDVVVLDPTSTTIHFIDCAAESPKGRRSLCYDDEALEARKEHKPAGSALALAERMGVSLLDETQYRLLQQVGTFDLKTSSWIQTPLAIRKLDGALFCDRRYDHVFTYHNGASSYYAARGFRAILSL